LHSENCSFAFALGEHFVMLQSQLRNDLGRAGETESARVERYVIEGRIVNLGVEITPDVPASCMIFLPDKFGRFGRW
jgi:hypothetical protein